MLRTTRSSNEWPQEKKDRFLAVLARHAELRGVHDMRTRSAGHRDFVQFHAAVDGAMSLRQAHRVMDDVEALLRANFSDLEVIIHPDPDDIVSDEARASEEVLPH